MLISLLKKIAFVAAVLLIGQFPVGNSNLASRFYAEVGRGLRWGSRELGKNKWLGGVGESSSIWLKKAGLSGEAPPKKDEPEDANKDPDGLTPSDKQALMRLLE